jgi:hypothetical protein
MDILESTGITLQALANFVAAGGQRCPELESITLLATAANSKRSLNFQPGVQAFFTSDYSKPECKFSRCRFPSLTCNGFVSTVGTRQRRCVLEPARALYGTAGQIRCCSNPAPVPLGQDCRTDTRERLPLHKVSFDQRREAYQGRVKPSPRGPQFAKSWRVPARAGVALERSKQVTPY